MLHHWRLGSEPRTYSDGTNKKTAKITLDQSRSKRQKRNGKQSLFLLSLPTFLVASDSLIHASKTLLILGGKVNSGPSPW